MISPQFKTLISRLTELKNTSNKNPIIVTLSGFGGSGKSTVAEKLKSSLGNAEIVSIDSFIVNRLQERSSEWNGFDRQRLTNQVLKPAFNGKTIAYEIYDWKENKIIGKKSITTDPQFLIVEGCSVLHPDLLKYYTFTIWIDCPLSLATKRGQERDRSWGVNHDDLWTNLWAPNEKEFFEKYHPNTIADFVLSTNDNPISLE